MVGDRCIWALIIMCAGFEGVELGSSSSYRRRLFFSDVSYVEKRGVMVVF